jgi:hypothetical protein
LLLKPEGELARERARRAHAQMSSVSRPLSTTQALKGASVMPLLF